MPIKILSPAPPPALKAGTLSEDEELDSEGDVDMETELKITKAPRLSSKHIVTPGEVVTDDPQWMRWAKISLLVQEPALKHTLQRSRHLCPS
jgi:hypothetical protein